LTFRTWSSSDYSVRNISSDTGKIDELSSEALFSGLGGVFLTDAAVLRSRLEAVRGLVFDWDGVFNAGVKGPDSSSAFSEADSMGTNMLRYGLWGRSRVLPVTAIITGEQNAGADLFVQREHFHALYQGVKHKGEAIDHFCSYHELSRSQLACVFDDINDLGMADGCGVRVLIRRASSPLLENFAVRHGLCDYITGAEGGNHAVREVSELLLGLLGVFDAVVQSRRTVDDSYTAYFTDRQAVETEVVDPGR